MLKSAGALGPVLVLDIETKPSGDAVALAPRGATKVGSALHRLTAFSALLATEEPGGCWTGFDLVSAQGDERDVLEALDDVIDALDPATTAVTWNGIAHDLVIIRRRAQARWMFDAPGLGALQRLHHIDLMRIVSGNGGKFGPALADMCAGFGIPMDHRLTLASGNPIPATIRKSQVDVVGTFLVLLYEIASTAHSEAAIVAGWTALAEFLGRSAMRAPHLEQFRSHPILRAAIDG